MNLKKLNSKVYENIREQMIISIRESQLNEEVNALRNKKSRLAGQFEAYAEVYAELTGEDLQRSINTSKDWAEILKKAQEEAEQSFTQRVQAPLASPDPDPDDEVEDKKPKLKRFEGNKTIPTTQPGEAKTPERDKQPVLRSREPVRIAIDDDPPGPDTADDPD